MNFYIVIPAHNEEGFIELTLKSLVNQTLLPKYVVVVNDNSTDNTKTIVETYIKTYPWISLVNTPSTDQHLPGAKIINAFYKGFETLDGSYDVICKFDADLMFPENYLEQLAVHFNKNPKLGMASGFCYIEKPGDHWVLENLTKKEHIRGALKAYRKGCFEQIGQLKRSIGWDTIDELLATYHGWHLKTDDTLHVKHLKPTGISYNQAAKYTQGEAMYKMRLGFILTAITGLKMAFKKKKIAVFIHYIVGYFKSKGKKLPYLVSKEEGKFIRDLRWKGIKRVLL